MGTKTANVALGKIRLLVHTACIDIGKYFPYFIPRNIPEQLTFHSVLKFQ